MSKREVEALIDQLVAAAKPVRPLAAPGRRALAWLGAIGVSVAVAVYVFADVALVLERYAGRHAQLALEMSAMLATGVSAIVGAFFLSIPGASRRWLVAPLAPFAAWLMLSGAGCYARLIEHSPGGIAAGESGDCLMFIVAVSLVLAVPLVWRLARARPIDPLPVALAGGLGIAALSAFVLTFLHPFTVTFLDLGMHVLGILIVVAVMGLAGQRTLGSAL